jgi:hypothetical protein
MWLDFFRSWRIAPKPFRIRRPRCLGGRTPLRYPERLETRLAFAAPQIGSLAYMMSDVDTVDVWGYVMDETPGSTSVTLSGAITGSASVNQDGSFYYHGSLSSLGEIIAVATDDESLSATNSVSVSNYSPTVSYVYAYASGTDTEVYVYGQVTDDFVSGSLVRLTGVVDATLGVDSSGYFSAVLDASGPGTISAQAEDYWGATSGTTTSEICASPPSLTFNVSESGANRELTLTASVSGLYGVSADAEVSGAIVASTSVGSSGQLTITQQVSEQGNVQVQITNVWGMFTIETVVFQTMAPQISSLSAYYCDAGYYRIEGSVCDEFAAGLTVELAGVLGNHSATVNAGGAFYIQVAAEAGLQGSITASVTDWWGVESYTEYFSLFSLSM